MLLDVLFAVGLLASTASQLRPAGASIGPGETCLAIWCFLMFARETGRLGPPLTPVFSRLLTFWIIFAVAMCLGTMMAFAIGDVHDPVWFMHDTIAYAVVATVSCLSVVEPGAGLRLHRVAWILATFGSIWLALQAAHGWGLIDIAGFEPWEWDRLRGLSDNANQLALLCAVIGLLSLHLAEAASRFGEKIAAIVCMTVAVIVGRLTKSDAFLLSLIAAGLIFIALKMRTWLSLERTTLRSASAWIFILALPLAAAYIIPLEPSIADRVQQVIKEMTRGGTSGDTEQTAGRRIHLWSAAMRRGIESGMLGLGPGPHLEIPPEIVAGRRDTKNDPSHVEHPQLNFTPNFEAHNTLLDLLAQGGFITVTILIWLVTTTLLMTLRAKLDALTTLLVGLATFSMFHLIVRHPIVWFAIVFCLVKAASVHWVPRSRFAVENLYTDAVGLSSKRTRLIGAGAWRSRR